MKREIKIGDRMVGDGYPAYIIAEIGINHNGDLDICKQMIDAAVHVGVDAVKFQKRTPEVSTPPEQQKQMRETPWGYITYLDYRYKVEFNQEQYREIDRHCREKGGFSTTTCLPARAAAMAGARCAAEGVQMVTTSNGGSRRNAARSAYGRPPCFSANAAALCASR